MEPILDWMEVTVLVRLVTADEMLPTELVSVVNPLLIVWMLLLMLVSCVLRPETLVLNAETAVFTEARLLVTFLPRLETELETPARVSWSALTLFWTPVTLVAMALRAVALASWLFTVNEPRPHPKLLAPDGPCLATTWIK